MRKRHSWCLFLKMRGKGDTGGQRNSQNSGATSGTQGCSGVGNLLHRHGRRKLAPDKRNVAADVQAQEEWKKTSRSPCENRKRMGQARPNQADVSR
jgi:hypothetical protein